MAETIEDIIDAIRKSTKKSVASITARRLESHGGMDRCAVDDAITCLRDDDRFLRDIANRLKRAIQRERKARVKRNCDRFKTWKEAEETYWTERHELINGLPTAKDRCKAIDRFGDVHDWLFAPTKKGGAE